MKKAILWMAVSAVVATMASCSSDKNEPDVPVGPVTPVDDAANIEYTTSNASSWGNYMTQVSKLLVQDATDLNNAWGQSYEGGAAFKEQFRNHQGTAYPSAVTSMLEVVDGCADIANEVGTAKIGDPFALYQAGNVTAALYAVESWYSWHSRDDYSNNINSIRNSYFGTRDGSIAAASLSNLVKAVNPTLDTEVKNAITGARNAIQAIPQPLRNNIVSSESSAAMDACADLEEVLSQKLRPVIENQLAEADLQAALNQYVDAVVLPTYADLQTKVTALKNAVDAFVASPSNNAFATACQAWLNAREPWETSEAFLFGPVDALGLDPNMDSWPLDQNMIVQILNSGRYDNLTWGDNDDDDAVEAVQSVRGFHTLEFLLFKDGKARTIH